MAGNSKLNKFQIARHAGGHQPVQVGARLLRLAAIRTAGRGTDRQARGTVVRGFRNDVIN